MRHLPCTALAVLGSLAGCQSHPAPLPPGPGVVSVDRNAPEGVLRYERPEWTVGDRFVFRRGGEQRITVRVGSIDEQSVVLIDETSGLLNRLDRDLGSVTLELESGEVLGAWDPVDARFTWPLWVGKRWACRYVHRDGPNDLPVLSTYHCDAIETVTVPAGEFQALRIWRRSRPLLEGEWLDRADLYWYAPDCGQVVRRLEDTVLTELEEVHRQ